MSRIRRVDQIRYYSRVRNRLHSRTLYDFTAIDYLTPRNNYYDYLTPQDFYNTYLTPPIIINKMSTLPPE
jgi:hypothetical protein